MKTYRIVQAEDGKFYAQCFGLTAGRTSPSWLFIGKAAINLSDFPYLCLWKSRDSLEEGPCESADQAERLVERFKKVMGIHIGEDLSIVKEL